MPCLKDEQIVSAAIYLETYGAISVKDAMTGSLYNLTFAAITVNIIEMAILHMKRRISEFAVDGEDGVTVRSCRFPVTASYCCQ